MFGRINGWKNPLYQPHLQNTIRLDVGPDQYQWQINYYQHLKRLDSIQNRPAQSPHTVKQKYGKEDRRRYHKYGTILRILPRGCNCPPASTTRSPVWSAKNSPPSSVAGSPQSSTHNYISASAPTSFNRISSLVNPHSDSFSGFPNYSIKRSAKQYGTRNNTGKMTKGLRRTNNLLTLHSDNDQEVEH